MKEANMSELRQRKTGGTENNVSKPPKETEIAGDPIPAETPLRAQLFLSCMVVFFVAIMCYVNSLEGEMVMDDDGCIKYNPDVIDPDVSIFDIFQHDYWGSSVWDRSSHKSYRPLTVLSFRMNYQMVRHPHT